MGIRHDDSMSFKDITVAAGFVFHVVHFWRAWIHNFKVQGCHGDRLDFLAPGSFKILERHIRVMMNEELKKANISLARSKQLKAGDFVLYYGTLAYVSNVTGEFINIHTHGRLSFLRFTLFVYSPTCLLLKILFVFVAISFSVCC